MTAKGAATVEPASPVDAAQPRSLHAPHRTPSRLPLGLGPGVVAVLLGLLYWPTFADLGLRWLGDPTYSHGPLVPIVSGWLAWRWLKRRTGLGEPQVELGTLEIAAGIVIHLMALVVVWPLVEFVGLVLVLRGLALVWGGREWARGLAFPILFLFFMFPLPVSVTGAVAVWLQDVVAMVSTRVLELIWVCQQRGQAIVIAGLTQPLVVGAECSGLRQMVAFLALATLMGYLWLRPWWARLLLASAAVPVAVLANVLRVLIMAGGAKWFGTGWLESWLHDAPGLVTFPAGLVMLGLLTWGLSKPGRRAYEEGTSGPHECGHYGRVVTRFSRSWLLVAGCLGIGLLLQFALLSHLSAGLPAEEPRLTKPLSELPTTIGTWRGADHPDAPKLPARVDFADELLLRTYRQAGTKDLAHVYMVYSSQGKDRDHHPEICIRDVAGLPEDLAARAVIHLDREAQRPVARFRFRGGKSQPFFVYYWHYALDAPLEEGLTWLQAVHRRLGRPRPSVTVQVTTVWPPDQLGQLEQGLLKELDLAMRNELLPAHGRIGCDRQPVRLLGHD